MRYILIILLILLQIACEPISNEKQELPDLWKFKYDPENQGLLEGWFDRTLDRSDWQDITVPGTWDDLEYDGFGWYHTKIQAKKYPAGSKLALVFESVDDNAVIWLDGRLIGKHNGYGKKFYIDMDDKLDDWRPHDLVVRIEDLGQPGGINKPVYLQAYLEEEDLIRSEVSKLSAPEAPQWVQNAAIYELFIRSHSSARSFEAVEKDLDRIEQLGTNVIWFMPIHPIGVERHKEDPGSPYAVRDYYAVNPRFGTFEDFERLVEAIHAKGMYVILDMVLNHTAWDNPLIEEHPEWYTRDANGEITHPPNTDWTDVADLSYDSEAVQDYMIDMLVWWLKEQNIDGFRFDVAELVPNDFWVKAKQACEAVNPDVFFLAEGDKPELHLNGFDMTYSWNIWQATIDAARGDKPVSALKASYEAEAYQYPKNALRMRFTENHDKNRSHANIGDKQLNETAWAFVALMDGNPLIYAGQEVGARRRADIHIDPVIYWSRADRVLERTMGEILALRKEWIKADSEFEVVLANDEKQIIAYKHGPLLAFFNFSDQDFEFSATNMDSILYGDLKINSDNKLTLAAKSYGVIK
ncbi:MAG: hypothetical protein K9M49_09575 [Candidatus Marinimicrobia bacterium]|nr:hypothetical protein [Candidatus Neomarinimicrobiota bacterium]MCF7851054.1 hypothetical protein [Candidatus Neomarinimicrobiota bacterium]MCF7905382.1 hypothetical protein [Candidatus Neomarinimicrobiota bacterium]